MLGAHGRPCCVDNQSHQDEPLGFPPQTPKSVMIRAQHRIQHSTGEPFTLLSETGGSMLLQG